MNTDKIIRLKRLYFRSHHRGSKESDLILGNFASANLEKLSDAMLNAFESFLDESDNDIWDWVVGKSEPEDGKYKDLIATLRKSYELNN